MWLKNEKGKPSATLTFLTLSVFVCITLICLHSFDVIKHTSSIVELVFGLSGLYFGRKIEVKTKNFEFGEKKE